MAGHFARKPTRRRQGILEARHRAPQTLRRARFAHGDALSGHSGRVVQGGLQGWWPRAQAVARRSQGVIWAVAVSVVLASSILLAIVIHVEDEVTTRPALLASGAIAVYLALLAWGWMRGGRREVCHARHFSRSERWSCSMIHRRSFVPWLVAAGISGVAVAGLALSGAWQAVAVLAMFPAALAYIALTYVPKRAESWPAVRRRSGRE